MTRRAAVTSQSPQRESCEHAGYYSGVGLYSRESEVLRYVLVCDDCGAEIKQISAVDYSPCPVLSDAA